MPLQLTEIEVIKAARYTDKYKGHNMEHLIARMSVGVNGPTATTSVMLLPTESHIQQYSSAFDQHLLSMSMTSEACGSFVV